MAKSRKFAKGDFVRIKKQYQSTAETANNVWIVDVVTESSVLIEGGYPLASNLFEEMYEHASEPCGRRTNATCNQGPNDCCKVRTSYYRGSVHAGRTRGGDTLWFRSDEANAQGFQSLAAWRSLPWNA